MREMEFMIIVATLPAVVLMWHMYRRDEYQHEPIGQLLKGFLFGIGSIGVSLAFSFLLGPAGVNVTESPTNVWEAFEHAFLGAGLPEESAKLLMLWLLLHKSKHFNEHIDGIVYAVMVGMGFAMVENVMYIFENYDCWLRVGLMRALFSVPGHFSFAVFMGYFYSKAHFDGSRLSALCTWAIPVLLHTVFDAILFLINGLSNLYVGVLFCLFVVFCIVLSRLVRKKINKHLQTDLRNRIYKSLDNNENQYR